jgi:hypothetical protein
MFLQNSLPFCLLLQIKADEKLAESEEDLLEHRTDGTDAFDTLFIGAEKFPQQEVSDFFVGGIS